MRIGFLDVSTNQTDAYEAASALCEERVANVSLSRVTAPDLLKIPVCAKRLFNEGVDAVLVFVTATSEDSHVLDLVHEKLIDVELESSKFVFTAIVFADEWRTQEQLAQATSQRLAQVLEELFHSVHAPEELAPTPPEEGAMGMFGTPTPQAEEENAPAVEPPEGSNGPRSLF